MEVILRKRGKSKNGLLPVLETTNKKVREVSIAKYLTKWYCLGIKNSLWERRNPFLALILLLPHWHYELLNASEFHSIIVTVLPKKLVFVVLMQLTSPIIFTRTHPILEMMETVYISQNNFSPCNI